ncbi:hypothetical protein SERLA73DRAFT_150303 [Serpula lacrymans var. lacrymans S7.3]|uniref:Uncharacterized protein n=2 Tax=Serpula lacrymans var. lacrymans TaxID=341189 RepID=F8PLZ8_SERL3|nr:uncharacterized protein SERLADRAFT_434239 [Serpula lacrymans var. lacrymans S7.9]EGO02630.1 hypothetical protein SERLA73DRAFT_150303 [Serpula lacrymans var. lacrymans S7.3]EGO28335.1 hypothetical protein SERLADRAFT_434239 [Serpula lacrymans var. lacrymans S7.9]
MSNKYCEPPPPFTELSNNPNSVPAGPHYGSLAKHSQEEQNQPPVPNKCHNLIRCAIRKDGVLTYLANEKHDDIHNEQGSKDNFLLNKSLFIQVPKKFICNLIQEKWQAEEARCLAQRELKLLQVKTRQFEPK